MKHKLLLTMAAGCFVTCALAQPTLTSAINPVIGDSHNYYGGASVSPGPSGANQTWDFSTFSSSSSSNVTYQACSSTPQCSSFPGSNITANQQSGSTYNYFNNGTTKSSSTGVIAGGVSIPYSDPEDFFQFPTTYNSSYTDNFAGSFTNGMMFYRSGNIHSVADGYGTLKTPAGTFNNVMRTHRTETYQDSVSGFGVMYEYVSEIYAWYSPGARDILFSVSSLTVNGNPYLSGSFYTDVPVTTAVAGISAPAATLKCYPNPAGGTVHISFRTDHQQHVRLSLLDVTGLEAAKIADYDYGAGNHELSFDLSSLPRGLYGLCITTDEGKTVPQKVQVL